MGSVSEYVIRLCNATVVSLAREGVWGLGLRVEGRGVRVEG